MSIDFREECYMLLLAWSTTNGIGIILNLVLDLFIDNIFLIGMIIFASGSTLVCLFWLFSVLIEIHIYKKNNKRKINLIREE